MDQARKSESNATNGEITATVIWRDSFMAKHIKKPSFLQIKKKKQSMPISARNEAIWETESKRREETRQENAVTARREREVRKARLPLAGGPVDG